MFIIVLTDSLSSNFVLGIGQRNDHNGPLNHKYLAMFMTEPYNFGGIHWLDMFQYYHYNLVGGLNPSKKYYSQLG